MIVPMREACMERGHRASALAQRTAAGYALLRQPARAQPVSVRPRSTLQRPIRRHTRQPLSSLHVCESTHLSPCEHRQDMLRYMARGWQAWLRYQSSAARAKRATSRALAIIAAHASSRRHLSAKPRRAAFSAQLHLFSRGLQRGPGTDAPIN